ncbi:MAG TPA: hypothetical protein VGQ76_06625 [Thermoanaerobaculia bacterium]|jgi:hypothetical protein|nr:hypothetical protein [Thermoanaerobaculia bacterium]
MKRTILALVFLAACSSEKPATTTTAAESTAATPPPTAQQARAIIEKSAELGQHEFTNAAVSLPIEGANMNEPTRAIAKQLAAAGWLEVDGEGDLFANDKSRNDKRFLWRENGLLDVVPLARKEMGDVTAVRANADGSVNADFSWKWIPNEVGAAFKSGPVQERFAKTNQASANLMWNGSSWTMIMIETK